MELYFGLGDAVTAEDVTVTWADASTSDLGAVAADQRIRVTPQGLVP
jgi:hypothetical protein